MTTFIFGLIWNCWRSFNHKWKQDSLPLTLRGISTTAVVPIFSCADEVCPWQTLAGGGPLVNMWWELWLSNLGLWGAGVGGDGELFRLTVQPWLEGSLSNLGLWVRGCGNFSLTSASWLVPWWNGTGVDRVGPYPMIPWDRNCLPHCEPKDRHDWKHYFLANFEFWHEFGARTYKEHQWLTLCLVNMPEDTDSLHYYIWYWVT